ncbi:SWIM zinc finger family protein, partial [Streptomyces sp. HNM0663]
MTPATDAVPSLPPVAPEVGAEAAEQLTSRLRGRLDSAVERLRRAPVSASGGVWRVACGEDADVTLEPGPSGVVSEAGQARCSCLLAPRCLHRAAVLHLCPVAASPSGGPERRLSASPGAASSASGTTRAGIPGEPDDAASTGTAGTPVTVGATEPPSHTAAGVAPPDAAAPGEPAVPADAAGLVAAANDAGAARPARRQDSPPAPGASTTPPDAPDNATG